MMKDFFDSFKYAINGIKHAVMGERNMRIHICVAIYVYIFSFFYSFSIIEYCILTILIAGVITLELINTAIEHIVDNPLPEKFYIAGKAKDVIAGAVLIFSIGAAICGVLLFWDTTILLNIFNFFTQHSLYLILLLLSFVFSLFFIFGKMDVYAKK